MYTQVKGWVKKSTQRASSTESDILECSVKNVEPQFFHLWLGLTILPTEDFFKVLRQIRDAKNLAQCLPYESKREL